MKNNVICIFVDSVAWECVGTTRAKISPTPFLDSLKDESITASKLYSHGPYTEAAKRSLFTGRNCMDDFGYYFKFNSSPMTDFKLFHDAGYETYGFYYPFFMMGHNVKKYIDHSIYTSGFVFGSEWGVLFDYYYNEVKKRKLNDNEYLLIRHRLKLFFEVYKGYLEDLRDSPESSSLYRECLKDFDIDNSLSILYKEEERFDSNQNVYIDEVLTQGKEHVIAHIDTTRIDSIIDRVFLESKAKENSDFFRKIRINNFKANWIKLFPSLKRIIYALKRYIKTKDSKELLFFTNYMLALTPFKVMRLRWGNPNWQNDNSIFSILNEAINVLEKRGSNDKPFYMYLNTDDPHNNISMFAYDTQNHEVVDDEIRVLKDYVDQLGVDFEGNLLYFLSLRYVDYEIEKFCNRLKDLGLWENTTLMVLSDHGSSYTFKPLHNARVNCFDDECYHVPMLIRHPNFVGRDIATYQNSKDVLPTICDLVGIEKPDVFKGHSLLDEKRPIKNYIMTEYMGPGCPDLLSKRLWLSVRDAHYIIAYKVGIYEDFKDGELAEVYDLSKDPNAYYNINTTIDLRNIEYLLQPLKNRFEEIKRDSNAFIEDLRKGKIKVVK